MNADEQTSTAQQAKDAAGRVTDQVRSKSAEVMQQAQDTATQAVSQQKGRAAESVGTLADALRKTGQHLQANDQGAVGHMADQAADRLEQFSNDLQNKSVDEIVGDIEGFARREPGLFLGGAFLAGLLGARFFRSSAQRKPYGASQSRIYSPSGMSGYSRQGRGQFGSETTEEDYTGTYMPNYYGSGSTAESAYSKRQPSPQPPSVKPSDYPPASDTGDRPFDNPSQRKNE